MKKKQKKNKKKQKKQKTEKKKKKTKPKKTKKTKKKKKKKHAWTPAARKRCHPRVLQLGPVLDGGGLPAGSFDRVLLDGPCSAMGLRPRLAQPLSAKDLEGYHARRTVPRNA